MAEKNLETQQGEKYPVSRTKTCCETGSFSLREPSKDERGALEVLTKTFNAAAGEINPRLKVVITNDGQNDGQVVDLQVTDYVKETLVDMGVLIDDELKETLKPHLHKKDDHWLVEDTPIDNKEYALRVLRLVWGRQTDEGNE